MRLDSAIAAGALDAGCAVATGYPGSPATSVMAACCELAPTGAQVEWSVNERVAFELACGASIAGRRSLVCLKSVGLNVALDPVMVANLVGVEAGLVIAVGDDPGAHLSQNEQDSRPLAMAAELPLLEPGTPQQAYDMTRWAFDLSEQHGEPVFVRLTRWSGAQEGPIRKQPSASTPGGEESRDITVDRRGRRWISTTTRAVELHGRLHRRLGAIQQSFDASPFNSVALGDEALPGLIAVGCLAAKVGLVLCGAAPPVLALGTVHPLPADRVADFLGSHPKVLVLEDGEPVVERLVREAAFTAGLSAKVRGKLTGELPREGELTLPTLTEAVSTLGIAATLPKTIVAPRELPEGFVPPGKGLGLCRDCPYEPLAEVIRQVSAEFARPPVVVADPGCGVRLSGEPHHLVDVKYSMSSAIGIAAGIVTADPAQKVIALPGDSAFFHTGLTDLVEVAWRHRSVVVLLLDNGTTALTGYQEHPGSRIGGGRRRILPEALASAMGIPGVDVVDPADPDRVAGLLRAALWRDDVSVLVARKPCPYAPSFRTDCSRGGDH